MSYLVLARKYRPQTFADVIGQEHVTQTLTNAIVMGRVHHAVLFSGPRGTGKTTVARILAKALNCEKGPTPTPCNVCPSCTDITGGSSADVFEIDGASNNSVDQIRELRENSKYMPSRNRYKIYIIDEVHMLTVAAFNALLKTLEEPPAHVLFFFATTEPHKIPLTILSRCQRHDLKRIPLSAIIAHLQALCAKEGILIDEESLAMVAREADGCMRDALSLLDQLMACVEGELTPEKVVDLLGIVDQKKLFDISAAVLNRNIPAIIGILDDLYARGQDMKKLYQDIIRHFRNLMVVKMGGNQNTLLDLSKHEIDWIKTQVRPLSLTGLNQILSFLFDLDGSVRHSEQPKLVLDVAFIKLLTSRPVLPIETLIERIDAIKTWSGGASSPASAEMDAQGPPEPVKSVPETEKAEKDFQDLNSRNVPSPADGKDSPSQEDFDRAWQHILQRLSKDHPSVAALLKDAAIQSVNGNDVAIDVNGSEFNVKMLKREKNLALLQTACEDYFKMPVQIVILENKTHPSMGQLKDKERKVKEDALNHPLVSEAVAMFKGRIIDIKLIPD